MSLFTVSILTASTCDRFQYHGDAHITTDKRLEFAIQWFGGDYDLTQMGGLSVYRFDPPDETWRISLDIHTERCLKSGEQRREWIIEYGKLPDCFREDASAKPLEPGELYYLGKVSTNKDRAHSLFFKVDLCPDGRTYCGVKVQ